MLRRLKKPSLEFPDLVLESERLFMRPPSPDDWAAWAKVRRANQDHIQPFEPLWPQEPFSEALFQRRIERQSQEWALGYAQAFLIFKREDGALIGGMNINNICRGAAQYAALGYWIDKAHEGQGYMAEAIALTLAHCFETLGLHRVNASCLPHNIRSKKTLIMAGFKQEGFAEKYLQINGVWEDHLLFGLPIEEWSGGKSEI